MLETLIVPKHKIKDLKQISFNLGVASLQEDNPENFTQDNLLSEAKKALKEAIRAGKDKTEIFKAGDAQ